MQGCCRHCCYVYLSKKDVWGENPTRMHFWRKFSQILIFISCHWQWRDIKTGSLSCLNSILNIRHASYSMIQNPSCKEVLVNRRQLIIGWTELRSHPWFYYPSLPTLLTFFLFLVYWNLTSSFQGSVQMSPPPGNNKQCQWQIFSPPYHPSITLQRQ